MVILFLLPDGVEWDVLIGDGGIGEKALVPKGRPIPSCTLMSRRNRTTPIGKINTTHMAVMVVVVVEDEDG